MHTSTPYRLMLVVFALLLFVTTTACGSVTPAPATAAPPTAAAPVKQPSATAAAATATPPAATATSTTAPSATAPATAAPTATAVATATGTPVPPSATPTLGAAENGLSAWCMPDNSVFKDTTLASTQAPSGARIGEIKDGALEVKNLPASACAFLYTFNQAAPTGLKLELYDVKQAKPWLVADLLPVEGSANTVAAVLHHSYIIAPPYWNISYNFAVRDSSGTVLRQDRVNLHRWTPKLCWNGQYPNVFTQRCPRPQDLHPWDPSYLTPMPTFPPGVNPEQGW